MNSFFKTVRNCGYTSIAVTSLAGVSAAQVRADAYWTDQQRIEIFNKLEGDKLSPAAQGAALGQYLNALNFGPDFAASQCDAVLIPTKIETSWDYEKKLALLQSIQSQQELDAAHKAGLGASYGGFRFSANYDDFTTQRDEYLASIDYKLNINEARRLVHSFLPPELAEKWLGCIRETKFGLVLYIERASKESVTVGIDWKPSPGIKAASQISAHLRGTTMSDSDFMSRIKTPLVGNWSDKITLDRKSDMEFSVDVTIEGNPDSVFMEPFRPEPQAIPKTLVRFFACKPSNAKVTDWKYVHCGPIFGEVVRNDSDAFNRDIAEYRFNVSGGGDYKFGVKYGSDQNRPIKIFINGKLEREGALGVIKNGYFETNIAKADFTELGQVSLISGENVLRFESGKMNINGKSQWTPFPHIYEIRFDPS